MFKQFLSHIIVYNVIKKIIEMKISKKFEPIINGLAAGFVIAILALLTFESPFGVWLMFSFGSSALIVFVFYDSEFAQPRNIFFGHLLAICVGILVNSLFS
jgi:CBS-domain-containing membrane protein